MARDELKSWIRSQSIGMTAVVIVAAVIGMMIARRMAFVLEGTGDVLIVVAGIPTMVLFFGSLYIGALALISLVRDLRGEGRSKIDVSR